MPKPIEVPGQGQFIEVPGQGLVEFPDSMSDEQIVAAIKRSSSMKEPEPPAMQEKPLYEEMARVAGKSLYGGLTAIPRAIMAGGDFMESQVPTPDWTKVPIPGYNTLAGADRAIMKAVAPETEAGKFASSVGEGAVSALTGPWSQLKNAMAIGAMAGGGADIAGRAVPGSLLAPLAGGLAAGGLGGLATAAKTNRGKLAQEALADVRPDDLEIAMARMRAAEAAGVPINLSQAMPRGSNIDAYVEALANSPHGKKVTEQLRNQPAQVAMGAEDQLANLPGKIDMPQVIANNAQEAADTYIRKGMEQAGEAWRKNAPKGAVFSEGALAKLDKELGELAKRYPNTASEDIIKEVQAALRAKAAPTEAGSGLVDASGNLLTPPPEAAKYLTDALQVKGAVDDVLQNYGARKLSTTSLQGKELKTAQEIRQKFRQVIDDELPELSKANRAYETVMQEIVNPARKSIIGRVAGRAGANSTQEAASSKLFQVFDKGTVPGSTSSEILTLEKAFRQAGKPEVYQDAAKYWIANKISAAMKSKDSRISDDVAGKLREVFGNPRSLDASSKGMEDILAGLARSKGVPEDLYVRGFKNFMATVSDAARRPKSVSGTTPGAINEAASEGVFKRMGQVSVMTPIRQPALKWAEFLKSDALSKMDELLTSPEGVAMLVKLGKQPPRSHAAVTTVSTFLGTAASAESPGITNE